MSSENSSRRVSTEQKRWEEIYKPSPIIAPLGGIVIAKQVERGQTVGTGDTVFVISDRLIILAQVDETDLGKISLNQPVEIRVDAYNDQVVTGKVIRIAYESKQVNNVTIYEIRILPDNVPEFMRSGMTTSVKFIQNKKENILLAPVSFLARPQKDSGSDSTLNPGDSMTVLSPSANPKDPPKSQDIVIGINNGKFAEVTSGLTEGSVILQSEQADPSEKKSANPFSPFGAPKSGRKQK